MANLETLFINIDGNADKAKGGIDNLITSLSSLGTIVDDICRKFVSLTSAIQSVQRVGNVKLPSFSHIPNAANPTGGGGNAPSTVPGNVGKATQEIEKANNATHKWGKTLDQIGRIAKTLVIRTALRALIKSFSETWTAAYNYSKAMGGEFSQNVEKLRGAITGTATKIVTTFAPALNFITPIVNVVASGIAYLCKVLQELMSLMGIAGEMFDTSAESIQDYADATGAGSKGAKGLLASFDELNVIQSGGGGTSPTGSAMNMSYLSDAISEEMAKISVIVGESLIALGLILAFSGHIPIGVGLIAVGAASIVKTVVNDWGSLTNSVKGEIAIIMAAAGAAMLALGAILAFSGANIPLGIALIAVGVANIATAASLSWNLDNEVKGKIAVISAAIGGALLAIGAVLAFSGGGVALGIGLMIAGAASLATSAALTWNMDSTIAHKISLVTAAVGGAFLALGAIFAFSGAGVGLGIAMMLIGAASLATSVAVAWNTLSPKVQSTISTIGEIVGGSLLVIGAILCFTGAGIPLGIGLMLAGAATLGTAVAVNWDAISKKIKDIFGGITSFLIEEWGKITTAISTAWGWVEKWAGAAWDNFKSAWGIIKTNISKIWSDIEDAVSIAWGNVKTWVNAKWESFKSGWENIKTSMCAIWTNVQTAVSNAWEKVSIWANAVWSTMSNNWDNIQKGLSGAWDLIKGSVEEAWKKVDTWKSVTWNRFSQAWDSIKDSLVARWDNIKTAVADAWGKVAVWAGATYVKTFATWDKIKTSFVDNIWNPIKQSVSDAWDYVKKWSESTWESVKGGWATIKENFVTAWGAIGKSISNAWDNIKDYWLKITWESRFKSRWNNIKKKLSDIWSGDSSIKTAITTAWEAMKSWFSTGADGAVYKIKVAWLTVKNWFKKNVTDPISNAFKDAINWIIDKINIVIKAFNSVGNFTTPKIEVLGYEIVPAIPISLWKIGTITPLATGGFPNAGDLFIANESGAELIGSMNGRTTVANQEQIIEGIRRGVSDANDEQNALLRQQNELLRGILQKEWKFGASSAFGRVAKQSLDMYGAVTGV